jgi:hypothetical protein
MHLTASLRCLTTRRLTQRVVALEKHGFSVEVVENLDGAREAVLERIPDGFSVMTNTSVTVSFTCRFRVRGSSNRDMFFRFHEAGTDRIEVSGSALGRSARRSWGCPTRVLNRRRRAS